MTQDAKFILPGPETVTLSGHTVDRLIKLGDGDAALLYLYILKTRGQSTPSGAAKALGKLEHEITAAMKQLGRLGLITFEEDAVEPPRAPAPDEPPGYTQSEVTRELENGAAFSALVDEVQRSLGKLLSPDELTRLFGIYDNLRLPPEVILQLVTNCIEENRRRYGEGRTPTMRYIEKAAYIWEREGVFSLERAEEYIKLRETQRGAEAEIKRALQIKDRELSATERKYVESWITLGFAADAVELAYDRTVLKTGRLAWGYMDSIINSWHSKGLHTPEEIRLKDGTGYKTKRTAQGSPVRQKAPDAAELARMERLLKQIEEG